MTCSFSTMKFSTMQNHAINAFFELSNFKSGEEHFHDFLYRKLSISIHTLPFYISLQRENSFFFLILLCTMKVVGSISHLGGARRFEGAFFVRKRGHFLKIKRALLCLLQNLGGWHVPPVLPVPSPVPTSMSE